MNPKNILTNYWNQVKQFLLKPQVKTEQLKNTLAQVQAEMQMPVLWLIGKAQSGKSTIIHSITHHADIEIGQGFKPQTRYSRLYTWPEELPSMGFLDTRGLGEKDYDPAEDIAYCEAHAHLVMAVMKVADCDQNVLFNALQQLRKRHPHWPILMVQTCLHECYDMAQSHIEPYPYGDIDSPQIPEKIHSMLIQQRKVFLSLSGSGEVSWAVIDFTQPEDGFSPQYYGWAVLWDALEHNWPNGFAGQLANQKAIRDLLRKSAMKQVYAYSGLASAAGTLPAVDLAGICGVQAKMLHGIASIYGYQWDRTLVTEFLGLMGSGFGVSVLAKMLGRSLVKFIPVWGQTVGVLWGASAGYASSYALGVAAIYFFAKRQQGQAINAEAIRQVYADALKDARERSSEQNHP